MIKLSPALDGLRQASTHRFSSLFRIERTDGITFLFTDHDSPIIFNYLSATNDALHPGSPISGTDETYSPVSATNSTAVQKQAGLQEHNVDVSAVITSDLITDDDMRAGKYRNARVVEMCVDWKYPYAGYFYQNVFWIMNTTFDRETWKAQVSGTPVWFHKEIGHVYSHSCRWTLGDSDCQVDLAAFTSTGTVSALVDIRNFVVTGITATDHYYLDGTLTWLTGDNTGDTYDLEDNLSTNLTTQLNAYFPIQIGDTFTIIAGCDRLKGTCTTKFSNLLRYGGHPFLAGSDALLRAALV